MPASTISDPGRRRVAVVGAGVSGIAAAYHLAPDHDVTLWEAAPRLGGHARTVMAGPDRARAVDTGFIVYNHANYPGLTRFFEELDVPVAPSDMSFGASFGGGRFEYALSGLRSLFAQPRNAADPRFLRMLSDILRFNRAARGMARGDTVTIGELLDELGTGPWFRDRYLAPVSGAIWSTPTEEILAFPAQALVRFFRNHNLLQVTGQHRWWTVRGGSIEYVRRAEAALDARGVTIRKGTPVEAVTRGPRPEIRARGTTEGYDEVILATHADAALRLLADASPAERRALGAMRTQPNDAVLHSDPSVMPKRRVTWSSWNYVEHLGHRGGPIDLSYWMNSLQPIPPDEPMFVTLNSRVQIDERLVWDRVTFRHPVYDTAALAAQDAIAAANGTRSTWFAGAWMANGFHEDGFQSGLAAARGIAARARAAARAA